MNEPSLFAELLDIPDPDARAAFLDRACDGQPDLRARLERLLDRHGQAGGFLERPAAPRPDETAPFGGGATGAGEGLGARIGPYHLLEVVGEGGMGTVYMAEQTEPVRRRVALKVIKPGMDSKQVVARFEAERQALALMDHPNIARVFDGGATQSGGRPYFVMELVRGLPVTDYCDQARLTVRERLELFAQVCRAVQHAHQKGVIHRDLKPSNVLVTVIDGRPVPKVIDFGIAKATGAALTDRTLFTGFHQMVGTPLYMSPEQAELAGVDVDTRSDVYSLGVLLYQLLTGTTPVAPETLQKAGFDEMRRIIREVEPPTPSRRVSTLSAEQSSTAAGRRRLDARRFDRLMRGELDWVVMRALEKDRGRRYESAGAFAADVERYLADEPVHAAPPSAAYRLKKFARRNRTAVLVASAGLLLLALGTVGTTVGMVRALRAERDATDSAAAESAQRVEAEAQRDRAVREKARADTEAATARAVNEYLRHILTEASPDRNARNRKVTVEHVLQRAAARIPTELAGQPLVEAAIRLTVGDSLTELGKAEAALPHLERAAELRRRELGPEHPDTLEAELRVGEGYRNRGQFDRAEKVASDLLETCRRVLEPDHPHALAARNNLAVAKQELGRHDEAEKLFVEVLAESRRIHGETHDNTLVAAYSLACLQLDKGRPADAEPLFRLVVEASRTGGRPETALTIAAMSGLAGVCDHRKEHKRAEALFREVLAASRRVLGDEHPGTVVALNNLGIALVEREKPEKAEPLFVEALAVARRVHEPGHPDLVPVLESAAGMFLLVDKPARAAPLLVELIEFHDRKRAGPPGGLSAEAAREMLDEALEAMEFQARFDEAAAKRYDAAAALLEEAVRIRRKVDGPDHPKAREAVGALAAMYVAAKRPDRAIPLLESVLQTEAGRLGRKHPQTVNTILQLGNCYREAGRPADALPMLREACDALPAGRPQWRTLAGTLLQAYVKAGRSADAVAFGKSLVAQARREERPAVLAVATSLHQSGKAILEAGAVVDAEAMLRQALSLLDLLAVGDGPIRHQLHGLLGAALAGQGKNEEGERLLLSAYDGLSKLPQATAPFIRDRLRDTVASLVRLHESAGRPEKAREWAAKMPRELAPSPRPVR